MLLHIGAFHLDIDSQRSTPWQRLSPETRILCTLLLVFAIALTPNGRWNTWMIYTLGVLVLITISRVTLSVLLKRVAVEFVFIGVVVLGTLFRGGGDMLWQWGWFQITTEGLMVLGSVAWKALLSLLVVNVLILTTSIPALLNALTVLRLPPLLVAILASMYRYMGVLAEEFQSMKRAALCRNLMSNKRWQRLVIGNMMGALFIRTLDRGERVHQAMVSRGYGGMPVSGGTFRRTKWDITALTLTMVLTITGQSVYLLTQL